MNRDRLRARRKAWDDGAWVREAALAHAEAPARRRWRPARFGLNKGGAESLAE
jgi:ring-1,2-phenylacetyl-CoA epoxidase subunit PaaA